MKKFLAFPLQVAKYIVLAKLSSFPAFNDKLRIFFTLVRLNFVNLFEKKSNTVKTHRIFGYQISGFSTLSIELLFREVFVDGDYRFSTNSPTPHIIDCGANVGMSLIFFKMLYPNAIVHAFEPNPFTFEVLKKNVEANKLTNVTLHNVALSDSEGELDFFLNDDYGSLHGSLFTHRGGSERYTVKTERLSTYLKTPVDVIKIDVEGAENQILTDLIAANSVAQAGQYVLEYHHLMNHTEKPGLSAFLLPFEKAGFTYNIKTKFKHLNEFQDVFIHFYKLKPA